MKCLNRVFYKKRMVTLGKMKKALSQQKTLSVDEKALKSLPKEIKDKFLAYSAQEGMNFLNEGNKTGFKKWAEDPNNAAALTYLKKSFRAKGEEDPEFRKSPIYKEVQLAELEENTAEYGLKLFKIDDGSGFQAWALNPNNAEALERLKEKDLLPYERTGLQNAIELCAKRREVLKKIDCSLEITKVDLIKLGELQPYIYVEGYPKLPGQILPVSQKAYQLIQLSKGYGQDNLSLGWRLLQNTDKTYFEAWATNPKNKAVLRQLQDYVYIKSQIPQQGQVLVSEAQYQQIKLAGLEKKDSRYGLVLLECSNMEEFKSWAINNREACNNLYRNINSMTFDISVINTLKSFMPDFWNACYCFDNLKSNETLSLSKLKQKTGSSDEGTLLRAFQLLEGFRGHSRYTDNHNFYDNFGKIKKEMGLHKK